MDNALLPYLFGMYVRGVLNPYELVISDNTDKRSSPWTLLVAVGRSNVSPLLAWGGILGLSPPHG